MRGRFLREFRGYIRSASHGELKRLSVELREAQRERFVSGRPKKCELVERSFTDEEFLVFMDHVDDEIDRACFMLMATLGLRVGELAMLKGRDRQGDQLAIRASKGGFVAMLRLPSPLLSLIPHAGPGDRLFPRSSKQLRDRFRAYRAAASLDDVYMTTEPCGRAGTRNPRYRLSLHSLRHYAITKFYKACKDPLLTRAFARHRDIMTTMHYLKGTHKEEVESVLEATLNVPKTLKKSEVKASYG